MKTVIIPAWKDPYPVTVNGNEQRFAAGKKVSVEDDVAEIIQRDIDAHTSATAPTPTPEKNTPLRIKTKLNQSGKVECDTSNEEIIKAINAGKVIVCDKTDAAGVQQVVGYTDEPADGDLNRITVGGYSFEYLKNGYDITSDVACGFGLTATSPYTPSVAQRQCFSKKYLSFEDGSTIAVSVDSAVEYNVAIWFISDVGAKRMKAGASIDGYFTGTGFYKSPLTQVVPRDTAYIWINLKRADDSACDPNDITRVTVRKVS